MEPPTPGTDQDGTRAGRLDPAPYRGFNRRMATGVRTVPHGPGGAAGPQGPVAGAGCVRVRTGDRTAILDGVAPRVEARAHRCQGSLSVSRAAQALVRQHDAIPECPPALRAATG